jgi:hypothetical protein
MCLGVAAWSMLPAILSAAAAVAAAASCAAASSARRIEGKSPTAALPVSCAAVLCCKLSAASCHFHMGRAGSNHVDAAAPFTALI